MISQDYYELLKSVKVLGIYSFGDMLVERIHGKATRTTRTLTTKLVNMAIKRGWLTEHEITVKFYKPTITGHRLIQSARKEYEDAQV